jgi:hypothetical protein
MSLAFARLHGCVRYALIPALTGAESHLWEHEDLEAN